MFQLWRGPTTWTADRRGGVRETAAGTASVVAQLLLRRQNVSTAGVDATLAEPVTRFEPCGFFTWPEKAQTACLKSDSNDNDWQALREMAGARLAVGGNWWKEGY